MIAGRAGGAGNFFRALGAHATDAGLAEGETFEFSSKVRPRKPSESMRGKGTGRRLYVPSIGLSVSGKQHATLSNTPGLQQFVRRTLPCCRFNPLDSTRTRAVEHTLLARVAEAMEHHEMAPSMAIERLLSELGRRASTLRTCNAILEAHGENSLSSKHLDHQSAALARRSARSSAA